LVLEINQLKTELSLLQQKYNSKDAELNYKIASIEKELNTKISGKQNELNIQNSLLESEKLRINSIENNYKEKEIELEKEYELKMRSANIIGDIGEDGMVELLLSSYPEDKIVKTGAQKNKADVHHEIKDKSRQTIASIYYEAKNRKN
jgi:hypothetical protein